MNVLNQLSIKSKLMALVIGVSLVSLTTAGSLSWLQFRRAFQAQVFEHLTSVRASKGKQLETYFDGLESHIAILSEDRMVVAAMVELNSAYRELQNQEISNEVLQTLDQYYTSTFLPELFEHVQGTQIPANYRPTTQAGQYLQHHHIVNDGKGDRATSSDADNGSDDSANEYSVIHGRYHDLFSRLTLEFGYEDLYLINFDTGDIVYSVNKNVDYATSLNRGPYRRSNLAEVVAAVRNDPGRTFVKVADYKPYIPNYSAPTAFFAAPIYNGPHIVGILAVQFPSEKINTILTGNQEWESDGLGQTGRVYVVGPDFLMRSVSRSLIEAPKTYQEDLERLGLSVQSLNLIEQLKTSILLHPVETSATQAALSGAIATQIGDDYRGIPVLSSYAPLRLRGLRWAILAEIDKSEAFAPVASVQLYMGILIVILILLIALVANIAAQTFASPIQKLLDITAQILKGERNLDVLDIELGGDAKSDQLEDALTTLLQDLQDQEVLVEQKTATIQTLLQTMMPPSVAARLQQGNLATVNSLQQVTILVARVAGLQVLMESAPPEKIAGLFDRLLRTFDEKARIHGLNTQLTIDETYVATCGITQVFLDHQERAVNFALDLVRFVESDEADLPDTIDLQIGIHSGPMVTGVVGETIAEANRAEPSATGAKFMYKLWGDTVSTTMDLNPKGGASNSILVTQPIHERLKDRYLLVALPPLRIEDVGLVPRWMVFTRTAQFDQQVNLVQTTFDQMQPTAMAQAFYTYLFEHDSELTAIVLGSMFQDESSEQQTQRQRQFVEVVQTVIKGMDAVDKLLPTLQEWGQKYAGYGLEEHHYDTTGEALLWSVEQTLGSGNMTPEIKRAWTLAYTFFRGVIEEATILSQPPAHLNQAELT